LLNSSKIPLTSDLKLSHSLIWMCRFRSKGNASKCLEIWALMFRLEFNWTSQIWRVVTIIAECKSGNYAIRPIMLKLVKLVKRSFVCCEGLQLYYVSSENNVRTIKLLLERFRQNYMCIDISVSTLYLSWFGLWNTKIELAPD